MPFSLPSPSSLVLLSSRNSATMVTWRHTSPLYYSRPKRNWRLYWEMCIWRMEEFTVSLLLRPLGDLFISNTFEGGAYVCWKRRWYQFSIKNKKEVEKLKYKTLEIMQPRIKKSELSAVEYTIPDQSTRSFRVTYKWRITRVRGGRLKREGAGLINFLPPKRRALIRERGKDTREKKDRRKNVLVSLPRLTLHFSPSLLSFRLTARVLD